MAVLCGFCLTNKIRLRETWQRFDKSGLAQQSYSHSTPSFSTLSFSTPLFSLPFSTPSLIIYDSILQHHLPTSGPPSQRRSTGTNTGKHTLHSSHRTPFCDRPIPWASRRISSKAVCCTMHPTPLVCHCIVLHHRATGAPGHPAPSPLQLISHRTTCTSPPPTPISSQPAAHTAMQFPARPAVTFHTELGTPPSPLQLVLPPFSPQPPDYLLLPLPFLLIRFPLPLCESHCYLPCVTLLCSTPPLHAPALLYTRKAWIRNKQPQG